MSRFGHRDQEPVETADDLRRLAQRKVQAALAGMGANVAPAPDAESSPAMEVPSTSDADGDPATAQALERMDAFLGTLEAVDKWGRRLTRAQLVRIVLGPPAVSSTRDADTADALGLTLAGTGEEGEGTPVPDPVGLAPAPWAERTLRPRVMPADGLRDHLQTSHLTLEDGVERFVFRVDDEKVAAATSEPEAPISHDDERLMAALERRYPDVKPPETSWAEHAPQGVGWPDDDGPQRR